MYRTACTSNSYRLKSRCILAGGALLACIAMADAGVTGGGGEDPCESDPCLPKCDPCGCPETNCCPQCPCDAGECCDNGDCVASCDDGDDCTTDYCDPEFGFCYSELKVDDCECNPYGCTCNDCAWLPRQDLPSGPTSCPGECGEVCTAAEIQRILNWECCGGCPSEETCQESGPPEQQISAAHWDCYCIELLGNEYCIKTSYPVRYDYITVNGCLCGS